ncbi:hypothetical protein [Paenibacillus sp. y28]|uniref:hypothetical protein n=1 Tax=Paenibacillus sp. y28 TaxID=3129110 RepID=UPI0030173F8D
MNHNPPVKKAKPLQMAAAPARSKGVTGTALQPSSSLHGRLTQLQRVMGNQGVRQMLSSMLQSRNASQATPSTAPVQRSLKIGSKEVSAKELQENVSDLELREVMKLWMGRARAYSFREWEAAETEAQKEVDEYEEYKDQNEVDEDNDLTDAERVNIYSMSPELFEQIKGYEDDVHEVIEGVGIGFIELLDILAPKKIDDLLQQQSAAELVASVKALNSDSLARIIGAAKIENWVHFAATFGLPLIATLPLESAISLVMAKDATRVGLQANWGALGTHFQKEEDGDRIIRWSNAGVAVANIVSALTYMDVKPKHVDVLLSKCHSFADLLTNLQRGISDYGLTIGQVIEVCSAHPNTAIALLDPFLRVKATDMPTIPVRAIQYLAETYGIANPATLQITYDSSRRTENEVTYGGAYHIYKVTVANKNQIEEIHLHVNGTAWNSASIDITHYKAPGGGGRAQIMGGPIVPQLLGLVTSATFNKKGKGW